MVKRIGERLKTRGYAVLTARCWQGVCRSL